MRLPIGGDMLVQSFRGLNPDCDGPVVSVKRSVAADVLRPDQERTAPAPWEIRTCRRDDVQRLVDWAADEGWNPGLQDADAFYAADHDGFLVGLHHGEPIAGISAVRYSTDFGFLGLFIVAPPFRGQGFGRRIWQAGLKRLSGGTVGLDAVVAQQANYRRSGFELAYRTFRFGGPAPIEALDEPLHDLQDVLFEDVLRWDRPLFGAPRKEFLSAWLQSSGRFGRAVVKAGRLRGYGVARRCRKGFKIGPLFADDPAIAERLFLGLAREMNGEVVFLDVPEPNGQGLRLAERWRLAPVFETGRMYAGPAPEIDLAKVFGVTTLELG
jgi:GNAT superfamily N-acetyltransferase